MPRSHSRTTSSVRTHDESGLEDSAPIRWAAQLLVGGLPGVLVCLVIMWMASKPSDQGSGAHIASIVPLLSANGLADSPAFHRLRFDRATAADHTPQFRSPSVASPSPTLLPQANATASTADFNTPRTAWKYLSASVRARIDASLAKRHDWESIVLHGSGLSHGNAKLLDRYHSSVRGLAQGLSYHFVIGNGSGANDGLIETGSRWTQALAAGDTQDTSISLCLIGDFNHQAPTKAQMEAVHELKDYLAIKLGKLDLTTHHAEDGTPSSCLGTKFGALGEVR